jgi:hypothetical protein
MGATLAKKTMADEWDLLGFFGLRLGIEDGQERGLCLGIGLCACRGCWRALRGLWRVLMPASGVNSIVEQFH